MRPLISIAMFLFGLTHLLACGIRVPAELMGTGSRERSVFGDAARLPLLSADYEIRVRLFELSGNGEAILLGEPIIAVFDGVPKVCVLSELRPSWLRGLFEGQVPSDSAGEGNGWFSGISGPSPLIDPVPEARCGGNIRTYRLTNLTIPEQELFNHPANGILSVLNVIPMDDGRAHLEMTIVEKFCPDKSPRNWHYFNDGGMGEKLEPQVCREFLRSKGFRIHEEIASILPITIVLEDAQGMSRAWIEITVIAGPRWKNDIVEEPCFFSGIGIGIVY